ncbi:Nuclear fusion protein tht1 [Schizosaccharomyces pombe]
MKYSNVAFSEGLAGFDSLAHVYQALLKKSTCYQEVAATLISKCSLLNTELTIDNRIHSAIQMTLCDFERSQILAPSECVRGSQSECVSKLESTSTWWLSFTSHFHDVNHLCRLANLEMQKELSIEVNMNVTLVQKQFLEMVILHLRNFESVTDKMNQRIDKFDGKFNSVIENSFKDINFRVNQEIMGLVELQNHQQEGMVQQKEILSTIKQLKSEIFDINSFFANFIEESAGYSNSLIEKLNEKFTSENAIALSAIGKYTSEFSAFMEKRIKNLITTTEDSLQQSVQSNIDFVNSGFQPLYDLTIQLKEELQSLKRLSSEQQNLQHEQILQWKSDFLNVSKDHLKVLQQLRPLIDIVEKFMNASRCSLP